MNWEELNPILEKSCNDSSLTVRLPVLQRVHQLLKDVEQPKDLHQLGKVSSTLLKTFTLYQDAKSKKMVTTIFEDILALNPEFLEKYTLFVLENVAKKPATKAVTDYLNLLEWIHAFLRFISTNLENFQRYAPKLLEAHTFITYSIETMLDNQEFIKKSQDKQNQHRRRIRQNVLQSTVKALSYCLRVGENSYTDTIVTLLLTKYTALQLPTAGVVILMGSLTKSTLQLLQTHPFHHSQLKTKYVEMYCEFLGKEVILGKNPPSRFCLETFLSSFIKEFVNQDLFTKYFLPNIEKCNLRSPEQSFNVSTELYSSVDTAKVDLVSIFATSKIMSQSFSNFKSSKETIRAASLQSVLTLLSNASKENTSEASLIIVLDEVFKNIKTNLNADYKTMASKILKQIPSISEIVSKKILTGLSSYVNKESNECALNAMLDAFFMHFNRLEAPEDSFFTVINNGLTEKKPASKKIWFVALLTNSFSASELLIKKFQDQILGFIKETLAHPSKQGQLATLGCFIFIERVAELSISEVEVEIDSLISEITEDSTSLGYAWIYITLSTKLDSDQRLLSVNLLSKLFQRAPSVVGFNVIKALEERIQKEDKQAASEDSLTYRYITPLFNALAQDIEDKKVLSQLLVEMLIVSQYKDFRLKNGWAGLVLSAKLDPSAIIKEYSEEILGKMKDIMENKEFAKTSYGNAAIESISYASFINPQVMAPILSELLTSDLQARQLSKLTDDDIKIWRGNDGELVFNVLETSNSKSLENKNTKDYETLKWEESIRKKQAKKNNGFKKLTKEEQIIVDEELEKESKIRAKVCSISLALDRSIQIIKQLARDAIQVDNGSSIWFPTAVTRLLDIVQQQKCFELVSEEGVKAFLDLSLIMSDSLGSMRYFLGLAILRVYGAAGIPKSLTEEPLLELVSRVLFRVKFVTDKQPFDSISLTYLLPLLIKVLDEGKKVAIKNADKPIAKGEFIEEDKEEEHLLLAIEIISVHAEAFEDPSIPRKNIVEVLLSLLALPSKAKLAKDCFMALCQNISVSPTQEDLNLILSRLMSANQFVRGTILEAIDNEFELHPYMKFSPEIFICTYDADDSNRETAEFIWEFNKFKVSEELINSLFSFFDQQDSGLRLFVASSYASATNLLETESSGTFDKYIQKLMDYYVKMARTPEPILDEYGLVAVSASEQKDPWEDRSTTAIAFKEATKFFPKGTSSIVDFIKFLVESSALGDKEPLVRQEMKEAGIEVITEHGAERVESLIPIFEHSLTSNTQIAIKENVIILYGSLARHLQSEDPRVNTIVERLLTTLDTPSEDVQQAVSACISPLVHLFGPKVQDYIEALFAKLFNSSNPVYIRRGSAWGIAGLVNGYGISSLSEFDIIRNLIEASEDKRDSKRRESVAFAFECLSKSLGKFFEPYVIEVLPNILKNLGDSVPEVRDATAEATKSIMAHTTSYGVKKLIPVAVQNLDEIAWRTKRGSVDLLGNMAYLDPTQLSASLSTIVPEIVGVLNDSHKEVRKAADQSLKRFGEVIRNPEIQKLVPTLINAIGDPTKYTEEALDALIKTQFVHYIDGPSLALIIHVIHRGMRDRSANTKRKACKIVGNMAILVDTKDLVPYLQQLIDEVEVAMVDPVPNTRATAARALGALVERLGEEQFPDLIPRLLSTLSDDSKSGDRLGSAQALSEVISGLGLSKLDEMLPTILAGVTNYRTYVREGFMPLLLFLPVCFGSQFAPYINQIIQPILSGLAETDENIHDTALKAGKLIVKNYATKAIDLLLPELERGMFDENERIRLSSVQLTGELLFQVTGISSKNEFSEEDSEYNGEISKQMVTVLGQERRDRILSALFACRSDTSGIVRATTVDIWKALVPNTPRTIKEILPTLTSIIVVHLASSSRALRTIAAQTLGDLVRRVGGNALSQLLPTLEESLENSTDSNSRQGVCIALRELIESSSAASLADFQDIIVNIIRITLIDGDETVREAAALSFDSFQEAVGKVAVDEVLPYLLNMLESSENSEYALLALQETMATKSEVIFPILIPTLLAPPIDAFRARALGSLAEFAGSALYKRLSTIINALVDTLLLDSNNTDTKKDIEAALDKIFASVTDDEGLHPLLQQIMALMKSEDLEKRIVVLERLPSFFNNTNLDYSIYTPEIVSQTILALDEKDSRVVKGNFDTLSVLVKKQDKPMLEKLIKPAKQALELTGKSGEDLMAFSLPRGPNCVLPIFLHGLMYGSSDEREASALAIADVVSKTPSANLKPFVTVITGPLIRVVGERFSSDIKAAILYALNILFAKVPQFLRPFIPQLQRTFVKSLSEPSNETLRLRAAKALGTLIEYQPRVDPLVVELVTGAKQATDDGVKTAMLKALLEVVAKAGSKLNEASKSNVVNLVEEEIMSADDKLAIAYARLIGSLSEILSTGEAHKILKEKVLEADLETDSGKFAILTLNSFLKDAPIHIFDTGLIDEFALYLVNATDSSNPYISDNGLVAIGKILLLEGEKKSPSSKVEANKPFELGEGNIKLLVGQLCKCMLKPESNSLDSRRLSLVVCRTMARFKFEECVEPLFDLLGPSVFSCLRDTIIPIKLAAEKAYLAIFKLVEEKDMNTFNTWFSQLPAGTIQNSIGAVIQLRSIGDYTKRVGNRLASVERERIAAGGDAETMFSDRFEDEREIWAVGGVDLNNDI